MKDIGSIFPLSTSDLCLEKALVTTNPESNHRIYYSLCREALFAVAEKYSDTEKVALIPAYTCQTVIEPFAQLDWKIYYYNITRNLRIDTDHLEQLVKRVRPTIVIVHPYHGMELNSIELSVLWKIKQTGCVLLEDITQCLYTNNRPKVFDYFIGSLRKWFKSPDGGFLETNNLDGIQRPVKENVSFVQKQIDAMYLRSRYFETNDERLKNISIRLSKEAVASVTKGITCHKMSKISLTLMDNENVHQSVNKRFANYNFLFTHINERAPGITFVCKKIEKVTTAPLYFPIYVEKRLELQQRLAMEHVYAPVLWPVSTNALLINDNVKYIYSHILMIPIDQRYDEQDMKVITSIINSFYEK